MGNQPTKSEVTERVEEFTGDSGANKASVGTRKPSKIAESDEEDDNLTFRSSEGDVKEGASGRVNKALAAINLPSNFKKVDASQYLPSGLKWEGNDIHYELKMGFFISRNAHRFAISARFPKPYALSETPYIGGYTVVWTSADGLDPIDDANTFLIISQMFNELENITFPTRAFYSNPIPYDDAKKKFIEDRSIATVVMKEMLVVLLASIQTITKVNILDLNVHMPIYFPKNYKVNVDPDDVNKSPAYRKNDMRRVWKDYLRILMPGVTYPKVIDQSEVGMVHRYKNFVDLLVYIDSFGLRPKLKRVVVGRVIDESIFITGFVSYVPLVNTVKEIMRTITPDFKLPFIAKKTFGDAMIAREIVTDYLLFSNFFEIHNANDRRNAKAGINRYFISDDGTKHQLIINFDVQKGNEYDASLNFPPNYKSISSKLSSIYQILSVTIRIYSDSIYLAYWKNYLADERVITEDEFVAKGYDADQYKLYLEQRADELASLRGILPTALLFFIMVARTIENLPNDTKMTLSAQSGVGSLLRSIKTLPECDDEKNPLGLDDDKVEERINSIRDNIEKTYGYDNFVAVSNFKYTPNQSPYILLKDLCSSLYRIEKQRQLVEYYKTLGFIAPDKEKENGIITRPMLASYNSGVTRMHSTIGRVAYFLSAYLSIDKFQ